MPKSKKLRKWEWRDDLYGVNILLLTSTLDQLVAWMVEKFGEGVETAVEEEADGKAFYVNHPEMKAMLVIWFNSEVDLAEPEGVALVAHESFHGAHFVLRHVGLTCVSKSEEAFAYYTGYLVKNIMERVL